MQRIAFINHVVGVEQDGLAFVAMVDGEDVVCVVSRDALQDHFAVREIDGASVIGMFDAKRRRN